MITSLKKIAQLLTLPRKKGCTAPALTDLLTEREQKAAKEVPHPQKAGIPALIIPLESHERTLALTQAFNLKGIHIERAKQPDGQYSIVMTPLQWKMAQEPIEKEERILINPNIGNTALLHLFTKNERNQISSESKEGLHIPVASRNRAVAIQHVMKCANFSLIRTKDERKNYSLRITPLQLKLLTEASVLQKKSSLATLER